MEIKSNKAFDCYETVHESWNGGKDITLDGVRLVPVTILDKIRAEIKALSPEPTAYDVVDGNPIKDAVWEILADVLQIIDKYTAESEDKE